MLNITIGYNDLLKSLKKDSQNFTRITIAVLADFASQHLVKALKAAAIDNRISLTIWEAEYDSVEANVYNETSALYAQQFDYILIFQSSLKLYKQFSKERYKENFAQKRLQDISNITCLLQEKTKAKIILSNFTETDDGVFGNYANKTAQSFLYQLRKLNCGLMDTAINQKNLFITDMQSLITIKGKHNCFDAKLYILADIIFDLDFIALTAQSTLQIIAAIEGNFKKCIILDLDNTLWGGVIGDDGIENIQIGDLGLGKAFTNLQIWLHNLKERGIILAVSSKNNEDIAKEVFKKHPGMTLTLDDISVFAANWETKVDNIKFIQSILNISFDSMVFIDDNPFERAIVKQNIPDITVPDLPEDPAEYLPYLQSLHLFETASSSAEDSKRTKQYQEEASRTILQKTFTSEAGFLESLEMTATVKPADSFTLPRIAQLTQRSNQFNLRTKRYTDEDINRIMNDPQKHTLTVLLKDTFGDYGLISAVIIEKKSDDTLFIDTWIMSCRVLKRGVENLLLNEIVKDAKESGFCFIEGEYIATAKNALVKDHYSQLGFIRSDDNNWLLDVRQYKPKQTFIKQVENYVTN